MALAKKNVEEIAWRDYEPHNNVLIRTLFENEEETQIYAKVKPGGATIPHYHSGSELFFVISGNGKITLDAKQEMELRQGDSFFVPPKTLHQVENNRKEDLIIISTFQPAFSKQTHSWQEK